MRLPTIYNVREFVEAGGLMSYGPNFLDLYRRAADLNEAGANLGHTGWTPMLGDLHDTNASAPCCRVTYPAGRLPRRLSRRKPRRLGERESLRNRWSIKKPSNEPDIT
jgi:hypothetical protein